MLRFGLLALFATLSLGAAPVAGGVDPRIGSWTLVSAQSSLDPANTLNITDMQGTVHVVMAGETHLDFTAKPDGHQSPVPGNPAFNEIELHRIGRKQVQVIEKKDGAVVGTLHSTLSTRGDELTIAMTSKNHSDQLTVWTKSSGAKTAGDPLAGEWTEDLSKTRLRQGLVLKIDADGQSGVRFSGEYSYTARFDGKPYDLRNSRNDTVTLALIDPQTVDAVERRDNQVTQRDHWVVSPDRQQMTLTTSGTYETGQRVTEKLVFKKQP